MNDSGECPSRIKDLSSTAQWRNSRDYSVPFLFIPVDQTHIWRLQIALTMPNYQQQFFKGYLSNL